MHPQLLTFLKLTGLLAAAIAVFFVLTFITGLLIKVVLIAAVVAALAMGASSSITPWSGASSSRSSVK